MTWSDDDGGSYKQIPRITKVCTLYSGVQGKNPAIPKLFTIVLQGQNQV
jgi:hypothetical protein